MPLATNHLQNRLYPICRRRDRQHRRTITAHVKLYNAVQSARLTVVLQKNVQTWSGTWDDIFVFSAGGAGSAALAHEMRLSSGVYRAKIIADVYDPGGIRADTSTVYTAERIVS